MNITPDAGKILLAAHLDSSSTFNEIGKRAGVSAEKARYVVQRCQKSGVIKPRVFVNPFSLGLIEVQLLLAVKGFDPTSRNMLMKLLANHPAVVWIAEVGGPYQVATRIAVPSMGAATVFLQEIGDKLGDKLVRKELSILTSFTLLPKRYLAPRMAPPRRNGITISATDKSVAADAVSLSLLRVLVDTPMISERDLAQRLRIARETVRSRLRSLRSSGVIAGEVFQISGLALGRQPFRMLISTPGIATTFDRELRAFAAQTPQVVNIASFLGAYDYEMVVEVLHPQEVSDITSALYQRTGSMIERLEILPIFWQQVGKHAP